MAAQECKEKMNVNPVAYRGRIIFDAAIGMIPEVNLFCWTFIQKFIAWKHAL